MTKPTVFNYQEHEKLKADYDKLHSDYWELLTKYAHLKAEKTNVDIKCRILEADLKELKKEARHGKST